MLWTLSIDHRQPDTLVGIDSSNSQFKDGGQAHLHNLILLLQERCWDALGWYREISSIYSVLVLYVPGDPRSLLRI